MFYFRALMLVKRCSENIATGAETSFDNNSSFGNVITIIFRDTTELYTI